MRGRYRYGTFQDLDPSLSSLSPAGKPGHLKILPEPSTRRQFTSLTKANPNLKKKRKESKIIEIKSWEKSKDAQL